MSLTWPTDHPCVQLKNEDGKVIDTTYARGKPFTFKVGSGQVVSGARPHPLSDAWAQTSPANCAAHHAVRGTHPLQWAKNPSASTPHARRRRPLVKVKGGASCVASSRASAFLCVSWHPHPPSVPPGGEHPTPYPGCTQGLFLVGRLANVPQRGRP
jgi:hypothetical protein